MRSGFIGKKEFHGALHCHEIPMQFPHIPAYGLLDLALLKKVLKQHKEPILLNGTLR